MEGWYSQLGISNCIDALSVKASREYVIPVPDKGIDTAYAALKNVKRNGKVQQEYCDGYASCRKAIGRLCASWGPSQPGIHQTNSLIERTNGDILVGTCAALVEAGHPDCFWAHAAPCYVPLCSITELGVDPSSDVVRLSPYEHHLGEAFKGEALPCGCGAYFKATPTRLLWAAGDGLGKRVPGQELARKVEKSGLMAPNGCHKVAMGGWGGPWGSVCRSCVHVMRKKLIKADVKLPRQQPPQGCYGWLGGAWGGVPDKENVRKTQKRQT